MQGALTECIFFAAVLLTEGYTSTIFQRYRGYMVHRGTCQLQHMGNSHVKTAVLLSLLFFHHAKSLSPGA